LGSLEESDGSGSDYGERVSDTESQDAQLDRELSADAVPETSDNRHNDTATKRTAGTKTAGGKKAEQSKPVGGAEQEDEDEDEDDNKWEVISGPLPRDARAEAQQLGALVAETAEKIARKYKKSRREVVLAAGLSVRAARARNPHNMFKKWYAHNHSRGESEYPYFMISDDLLTYHSVVQ
jgi:hypothetical protein